MKHADFVHLHNHSDFSLLDGASPIPRMVKRAAELGMPAVALTDHGALFGILEFYLEARKAGLKPILGMEAYVTRGKRSDRTRDTAHHLVLLARDEQGFRNLVRLSSLAYLEGFYYRPRLDHEALAQHSAGLLALSACPKGEIASDLLEDNEAGALKTAMMYRDMFGAENFFLEVQNHGLDIEDKIRERVRALSRTTGIPVVATNDCHYLRHEDSGPHDVLLCIQTGKNVADTNRLRYLTDQVYFKSAEEMQARFADFPEALRNTLAVAERCNVELSFGKPLLPEFPLPAGVTSAEDYLRRLTSEGLCERFGTDVAEAVRQRADYEIDVICRMGFASYFLIVRDFIAFARGRGIGVGPGRGSVAGSLVAFALRITDINPLDHGLIFERFLNPERVTMPDIDIDFDDLRRGEVIEYVKQKYGEGSVTQIITFGTMGAKGVVRDVGRALGIAYAEVDKIARLVPDGLGMTLERAFELSSELKNLGQRGPEFERLIQSARVLEGLARHASTHAAGVLITPGPLLDYVPLYRQKDDSITTQWDMKSVEKAGLLKMDFLGLRTLSVLDECVRLVKLHRGVELDLPKLALDDAAAYKVFQEADTVAIFQFESGGMRDYLRRLKPTVFGDLVAMNALYRPGPMENIPFFIDCKHGRQVARYDHPALEPILKDTYGVFVYQEQVMAAAHALAGFSMSQADELRRAMGKKLPAEMEKKRQQFVEGCGANKIQSRVAERIFATMEKFAGYGFNRCVVGSTEIMNARTGEVTSIESLFRSRKSFQVHALGEDLKLRPRPVTDVVWNGRKEVFELVSRPGKRITATANHPFRTLDGWKRLDELAPGDRIAAPRLLTVANRTRWPRHEIVTLAGLLSEGNTCHPTTLYFYNNDPVMIADFMQAIGQFPDTVARVHTRESGRMEVAANLGRGWRVREGEVEYDAEEGNLAVALDAPRRSGAFEWAGRLGILGCRATQKRVPSDVFMLSDGDIELFLGRLWSGDGFVAIPSDHAPYYATSSRGFARDMQLLLLRLGIISRIHTKRFRYRDDWKPGYTVRPYGVGAAETFLERIAPHVIGREAQVAELRAHVRSTARGQVSADTVPREIRKCIHDERKRLGLTWKTVEAESGCSMKEFCGKGSRGKLGFRRSTIARLADYFRSRRLEHVAHSDVSWETVESIEPRGMADTYDLTIEHDHNFVANGLIAHNSHSAAYALLAYQSAYLKANYPAEFMAATLTSELSDSARLATLVEECRRMRLELLPPDVNRSEWKFTLEDGRIRYGLGGVRNVGQSAVDALLAARSTGPFPDLFDLARRLDGRAMNRRVLESLVAAGSCDVLGRERGQLFAGAGRALDQAASLQRERESGQSSLFGEAGHGAVSVAAPPLPVSEPWTPRERMSREKEALGFFLSEHPLTPLRDELARVSSHPIAQLAELPDGTEVRVAALVGEVRTITTKQGRLMGAVILEDLTGRIEATVFPDAFDASRDRLVTDGIVVLSGRMESRDDRGAKLLASEVTAWEQARSASRPALHLEVRAEELSPQWLEDMDVILSSHPGECDVYLQIVMPDRSRQASRSRRYRVSQDDAVVRGLVERFPTLRVRWSKGLP